MLEIQTRIAVINRKLEAAGWRIVPHGPGNLPSSPTAITEYPTRSGPADYVLFAEGRPLAVAEAKKASRDPYDSLNQAQRYSRDFLSSPFKFGEYQIPLIYSSNGSDNISLCPSTPTPASQPTKHARCSISTPTSRR